MSEEILEQQSEEELEQEQVAVQESSGKKIKEGELPPALAKANAAKKKANGDEEGDDEEEVEEQAEPEEDEEEEVEEAVSIPKTKAGMVKAIYDQLNAMKKAELTDSFSQIMGSTILEQDEEEEEEGGEEEEEKPMESKKLKKEDLDINVKDDMDALVQGEDLSEEFKTKASTIFEAAVSAKVLSEVNQRVEQLEESY